MRTFLVNRNHTLDLPHPEGLTPGRVARADDVVSEHELVLDPDKLIEDGVLTEVTDEIQRIPISEDSGDDSDDGDSEEGDEEADEKPASKKPSGGKKK